MGLRSGLKGRLIQFLYTKLIELLLHTTKCMHEIPVCLTSKVYSNKRVVRERASSITLCKLSMNENREIKRKVMSDKTTILTVTVMELLKL